MNKTQLYEIAVATGKSLVGEADAIKLQLAVANAAVDNKVDSKDFSLFQSYVNQARSLYTSLISAKLPSEMAALQQANKAAVATSNAIAQSAPAPAN
jgi:sialic acid synthase SpsE